MTNKEMVIRVLSHFPTNTFCAEGAEVTVEDVLSILKTHGPCEDAVSREAVLKEQYEVETQEFGTIYVVPADYIKSLPSATLETQVPKVMTLEEVQKLATIRDGAIWLELCAGLTPAFMEFTTQNITFFVAVPFTGYRTHLENEWYGKTWRCWNSRPTNEQRKAVKWNEST